MGLMSAAQQRHYRERGYLVVPALFSPGQLEPWIERLRQIVEGEVEPADGMLVMRDVMVAKGAVSPSEPAAAVAKLQDCENDPLLFAYAKDNRLLDWVASLIGPDIKSIHTMLINKPPNVDGRHPLHQDLVYFAFRPADSIVAAWTALEPVTEENGCLVVVPGTHLGELLPHGDMDWEYVNHAYFGAQGVGEETPRVHLAMQPGDTVLFHPLLLHGSGRNRTQGFRRAISVHYASSSCQFVDRSGTEIDSHKRRECFTLVRGREFPECI